MSNWIPPERPGWVQRLNASGVPAAEMVSLAVDDLLSSARRITGLEDFGDSAWQTHLQVLLDSLESEADLHLLGRTMTRNEIVRSLVNRLRLVAAPSDSPAVESPVFIVGMARSGTSILHELLDCDPANRTPATWELYRPVPDGTDRRAIGDAETSLWHDVAPSYEAMHHNGGDLPNECIFATMNEFLSDHWSGCHHVPTYSAHVAFADHAEAYRLHRRCLDAIGVAPGRRWVLKAPSHLATLPALFAEYPDARVILLHRDPTRTIASTLDLMATLKWMRSDLTDMSGLAALVPAGYSHMLGALAAERSSGALPDDRFIDVNYSDLVTDPDSTLKRIYTALGWDHDDHLAEAFSTYLAHRPQSKFGRHTYSLATFGLDHDEEHSRFEPYRSHFGVPAEPRPDES